MIRRVSLVAALIFCMGLMACASLPAVKGRVLFINGVNEVRLVPEEGAWRNAHPVTLKPSEIGILLHRVLYGEQRNALHRLVSGEAVKTRVFRDSEIALVAEPLSRALAQAGPDERVYFRLGRPGPAGGEEITVGWIFIEGDTLHLVLSKVYDVVAPGPDISKYQREMPDVPEAPTPFTVSFEPAEFLTGTTSKGSWLAPNQLEELEIHYRKALSALPPFQITAPSREERSAEPLP